MYQNTAQGGTDMFVTKLNPFANALLYSTYVGGAGDDQGNAIAIDPTGDAYIGGQAGDNTFPTFQATQPAFGGGASDGAVVVLDPNGRNQLFSTYLGGNAQDSVTGIARDATTNQVYVVGSTLSANFPTTAGAFQTTLAGMSNAFVAEFAGINPAGAPVTVSDMFESNDTSDVATNFGTLGSTPLAFTNLTINLKPSGFFDQDWYTFTAGLSGTLNVNLTNIRFVGNGGIDLRVFILNSNDTLTDIGDSTTLNATSQAVSVGAAQGQQYFVWVYGFNFSTAFYDLSMNIM